MVILAVALVVAGAALASLGVLRLTRAAFIALPRSLAISVVVAGAAVVAFGVLLPRLANRTRAPEITLEREPSGATPAPLPRVELRGAVKSPDGEPVAGVELVLRDGTHKPRSTRSDTTGAYMFAGLAPGGPYRVGASYRGGLFQRVVLLPSPPVTITVAPTTTKPARINVRAASLAIVGDDRGVQAVYAATLENSGTEAYVGGVPLPVLPGAMAVEPRAGIDRSQIGVQDGVLFSSAPVLPGTTPISYTYVAPMREQGAEVVMDVTFPTSRFDLLISGKLQASSRANADGNVRLGGRTYHRYTWRDLRAGQLISARVGPSSATPLLRTAAIVAGGVLAALIVAFPLVRRRRGIVPAAEPVPVQQ